MPVRHWLCSKRCERTWRKISSPVIEAIVPDADHTTLQAAAIAIGAAYADAARTQPAFTHMDDYLRRLRRDVRRILTEHGIGETQAIREKVEEFAVHVYGGGA